MGLFTMTLGPRLSTLFTLMSNISFLELHHMVFLNFVLTDYLLSF